jgi:WD40 repeat protein
MGLARVQAAEGEAGLSGMTATGVVMGTPDYIAPEQSRGAQNADARSDLYSLGCTLYFLLVGRPPFPEGSVTEKLLKHNMDEPVPVERLRPDVPAEVAAVVRTLMAKDPAGRFQTAAEVAAVLAGVLEGVPAAPVPRALPVRDADATDTLPPLAPAAAITPAPAVGDTSSFDVSLVAGVATAPDHRPSPRRPRGTGRRRVWLFRVAGTALAAAAVASLLAVLGRGRRASGPEEPPALPTPLTFRVDASRSWQDTGVEVRAGTALTLRAEGHWGAGHPAVEATADGIVAPRDRAVLPEAPTLCLLGRIGDAEPFVVGATRDLDAPTAGRLFLRANALDLDDTVGSLEVTIEGGTKGDAPAPAPAPTRLESVEAGLRSLQARVNDPGGDRDKVRDDVLDFVRKNAATFQANRARGLLPRLPSPLDALAPEKLPEPARRVASLGAPDRLPAGLVAVAGDGRQRHWREVEALAWGPDGKTLVSGSEDGSLSVWDAGTGVLRRHLFGHSSGVRTVLFDPDGVRLVSAGTDGRIKVWDTATGGLLGSVTVSAGPVLCLAWVAPGKMLASAGRDGVVRIWDTDTWKNPRLMRPGVGVLSLAWSEEANRLAAGCADGQVRLWDLAADAEPVLLKAQGGPVHGLAWRPGGKQLAAAGTDGILRLWEPAASAEPRLLTGTAPGAVSLAWNRKGTTLAFAGPEATVQLWRPQPRIEDDKPPAVLRYPVGGVRCLAWAPEGDVLASGSVQGVIKFWDGVGEKARPPDPGAPFAGQALAWAPDGRLLAFAWGDAIRVGEPAAGAGPSWRLLGRHPGASIVASIAFSPDGGLLVSGNSRGSLKLWDVASGKEAQLVTAAHSLAVLGVAFAPDGKTFASCSRDRTVKLWDTATAKLIRSFAHTDAAPCVCFSPDGWLLAGGGQAGTVKVWETATGKESHTLSTPRETGAVLAVAFSPNGRLLASARADPPSIDLWDSITGERLRKLAGNKDRPASLAWRPDGEALATGTNGGEAWLWNPATGEVRDRVQVGPVQGPVHHVTYSPDGRHLATANGNGTVYVLRLGPPPGGKVD